MWGVCGDKANGAAGPCSDNDLDLGILSEMTFIGGEVCSHPLG